MLYGLVQPQVWVNLADMLSMETLLLVGAASALTVLLLVWALVAWLSHRAYLRDIQRRLAWNEQSRFDLEHHSEELSQRLASVADQLKSLQAMQPTAAVTAAKAIATASASAVYWEQEQTRPGPLPVNGFADTLPFEEAQALPEAQGAARQPIRQ